MLFFPLPGDVMACFEIFTSDTFTFYSQQFIHRTQFIYINFVYILIYLQSNEPEPILV